ncbi:MAG: hypothetical protein IKI37_03830 [Oscillospiraceae bacterium]|nr:hypothetical protein [Oscillospiraceae bacterium]MBR7084289.1 hypothetical protein [Oscillospiraceae bacterium]
MTKHEQFLQEIQKNIKEPPSRTKGESDIEKELMRKFEELFGNIIEEDEDDEGN